MPDALLIGSTDTTIAVGEAILAAGIGIAAVVGVGESFVISYSRTPVANARFADVAGWASAKGIRAVPFEGFARLAEAMGGMRPAVCIAAGWYHMVPRDFRARFDHGCIGFHASLLPQLRGGAPLNWAILSGLVETGVTMLELGDGVDDGPVYGQRAFPIGPRATIGELVARSGEACVALVGEKLPAVLSGRLAPVPQQGRPSYGLQRRPEDGLIDWRRPAAEIDRLVRAVGRPYPGAYTGLDGERVVIWAAAPLADAPRVLGAPGQIARLPGAANPCVVCGDGLLEIIDATDGNGVPALPRLAAGSQKRLAAPRPAA